MSTFFYSFSTEERISLFRCFIYLCNFILTEKLINISQEKQQILEKSQKQKKNSVQQKLSFFLTSLIFLWLFWPQDFLEAPQSLKCSQRRNGRDRVGVLLRWWNVIQEVQSFIFCHIDHEVNVKINPPALLDDGGMFCSRFLAFSRDRTWNEGRERERDYRPEPEMMWKKW